MQTQSRTRYYAPHFTGAGIAPFLHRTQHDGRSEAVFCSVCSCQAYVRGGVMPLAGGNVGKRATSYRQGVLEPSQGGSNAPDS